MSRPGLTALITCGNEEDVLQACLDSVAFADEIYVVDSFSNDGSAELARKAGARVEQREYRNASSQKNWAIPRASHPWILLVDADERVTPELRDEVLALLEKGPDADAYWIRRDNYFLGKKMSHGGWNRDRVVRFFRRDVARYQEREVHAEVDLPGPLPEMRSRLVHDTFRSFDQYMPKVLCYSRWGASQAFKDGRRAGPLRIFGHSLGRFIRMYFLTGGILDGGRGLALAMLSAYATYLKYAILWELTLSAGDGDGPAPAETRPRDLGAAAAVPEETLSILHVNTETSWRGGEAQTLMLAEGLSARGHRCVMAAREGSALARKARERNLHVVLLPRRGGELSPRAALRLARALRALRPDVVHYHTSHAITMGTLASLAAPRAATVATRRVSFSLARNPLARLKYTARVDHLIAVADEVRWVMTGQGIAPERISVVHSGIDLGRFGRGADGASVRRDWGFGPGHLVIGSVGHLAAHKGQGYLVEAAAAVLDARPEARFVLIGEGDRRAALEAQVRKLGLQDRFVLPGFSDDVARVLGAMDLFAMPSVSGEGSPAVIKEALACGVPIVSSRLAGVREIVRDEKEALLVEPGRPEALAKALLRLAGDADLRETLAGHGLERVREFSVDRTVDRTLEVYRRVLSRRAKRGR